MEYLSGAGMVLLGLLIVIFGNTRFDAGEEREESASSRGLSLPAWLDHAVKWAIGLVCIWFGGWLLLGHGHFF